MSTRDPNPPPPDAPPARERRRPAWLLPAGVVLVALVTFGVAALLINIFERRQEARNPYIRFVEVDENTTDPAVWGQNWPRQYESFMRTVDYERTRYGGSDAIPRQKLDAYPWLRTMWAGHAFSIDYRESRGHAFALHDQDHTERVAQRPQPGACLHCHAAVMPAYRAMGNGDVMEGFRVVSRMRWNEARNLVDAQGQPLISHSVTCVDCHDPQTMALRVTRPGLINGMRAFQASLGRQNYDINRDATRQEMRTLVCAQCHVEYYFEPENKLVVFPWGKGIRVEQMIEYYDSVGFSDWQHGMTGSGMLKAQHPEFELFSQGIHARAGVACADCHMPYGREGAMKVSDHHVRSPVLNIQRACQTCHNVPEAELVERIHTIQDRTHALINRSGVALTDMINAISAAREAGVPDAQLAAAVRLQREAQFRIDFIYSEGSHGFHASQESARILAEALDLARQGQAMATLLNPQAVARTEAPAEAVGGVTPDAAAPPGPYERGGDPGRPDPGSADPARQNRATTGRAARRP
ncbi:ammonia-forming cytochrome c nitrite reductase subunit c552 [soil metagenome]